MTREEIQDMTVRELKEVLEAHGASTDGTKAVLVERATTVVFMAEPDPEPINVQGGAKVETVNVKAVAAPAEGADIEVITTAPGTLSDLGIVPTGTQTRVKRGQFSAAWMRPANEAAAKALAEASE